jgi:putative hydrolase of the HAD superfamily
LDIRNYFDRIIISSDVGVKKPEQEIFLLACNLLGSVPSNVVYVGDNYQIDIVGAAEAGLKAVWLNKFLINESYEYVISGLYELKDAINKITENV